MSADTDPQERDWRAEAEYWHGVAAALITRAAGLELTADQEALLVQVAHKFREDNL